MSKGKVIAIVIVVILALGGGAYGYHQHQISEMRNNGYTALESVVNPEDYREAERAEVEDIIKEHHDAISTLTTQEEVAEEIAAATEEISGIKTDAQLTAEEEEAARIKAEEEARKKAEEEAKRKAEEEARRQAEEAARQAAASSSSSSGGSSNSGGCVGNDADNWY